MIDFTVFEYFRFSKIFDFRIFSKEKFHTFENGIEDENNFQIQEIDFQNGIDEDDA